MMKNKYHFKRNGNGETIVRSQDDVGAKRHIPIFSTILCLLLAILIWFYVAGNDEGQTKEFEVRLNIANVGSVLADDGKIVSFDEPVNVVVTLSGRSRLLNKLDASKIKAYVDAEEIKDLQHSREALNVYVTLSDDVNPTIEISGQNIVTATVSIKDANP